MIEPCPDCAGTGADVDDAPCLTCDGTGLLGLEVPEEIRRGVEQLDRGEGRPLDDVLAAIRRDRLGLDEIDEETA